MASTSFKSPEEREVAHWKVQLDHAHRVWTDYGLTDQSPRDRSVQVLYDMYRNQSWSSGWGGIPRSQLIEVPMMFSLINTLMAKLFARHPVIDVRSENPEQKSNARRMEVLQNFLVRKRDLGFKRHINRALLGAMLTPGGVIRHGFSPKDEVFDGDGRIISRTSVFPDVPWIRSLNIAHLRMDPMVDSFHPDDGARWVAFWTPMTMREIERNPKLVKRRDLKPTHRAKTMLSRPDELRDKEIEAELDVVGAWTIYSGEDRSWLTITESSDKPIRKEAAWPLDWRRLPVNVFGFNPQLDTPFNIAPAAIIAQLCRERNKVRTLMLELVKRMRRIIPINESLVNDDDFARLVSGDGPELVEFLRVSGSIGEAIGDVKIGGFDGSLLAMDARVEEDARLALGQSLMDRGERINVESASESNSVQQGSDLQSGRNASPFEDFMSDVFATHGQALSTDGVITSEVSVPIIGEVATDELFGDLEEDQSAFLSFDGEKIRGPFIHEVRPGSAAPRNAKEEAAQALANVEVALKAPDRVNVGETLTDYFTAVDKDPKRFVKPENPATTAGDALAGAPGSQSPDRSVVAGLQAITGGG